MLVYLFLAGVLILSAYIKHVCYKHIKGRR